MQQLASGDVTKGSVKGQKDRNTLQAGGWPSETMGEISPSLLMQHIHWHCKQDALILPIDLHNIFGTSRTLSTIDCTRNRNNDAKGCLVVD